MFARICFYAIIFILPACLFAEGVDYTLNIMGVPDQKIVDVLESNSQLFRMRESHTTTKISLRRRAENDIPDLLKAMQSFGYYNAKIDIDIDEAKTPISVDININPGPLFPLTSFKLIAPEIDFGAEPPNPAILNSISLADLGIQLNSTAIPKKILKAEDKLLAKLAILGYPLAKIDDIEVVADLANPSVYVTLIVDIGPFARFGNTTIEGCSSVNKIFVLRKIEWCVGQQYDPCKINRTIEALEAANLFTSINIVHANELDEDGKLQMTIQLVEGKHRSIGAGISFSSERGSSKFISTENVGGTVEWENRNVRGMGEKLSLNLAVWKLMRRGSLLYQKPDFFRRNQDYLLVLDYDYDRTLGFSDESYQVSSLIERRIGCNIRISYGGRYKWIQTRRSNNNATFNILKAPFHTYWNNADSILDPTFGLTASFRTEPSFQVTSPSFFYCVNKFVGTSYYPLRKDHRLIFAGKIVLGTILGTSTREIPPSERFYAGSENTIRGYRYLTISPFDKEDKPIGGRSMMIFSFELRMRAGKNLGYVLFTDIGNVYADRVPQFDGKKLVSLGGGLRYFTPIGPLRFDLAFPLNRRKKCDSNEYIDGFLQFYISIGQAF